MATPEQILLHAKNGIDVTTEVGRRAQISRAYYAMMHLSRELAEQLGLSFDPCAKGGSHANLIKCLEGAGGAAGRVASKLRRARSLRVTADYELDADVTNPELADQLRRADAIFASVTVKK